MINSVVCIAHLCVVINDVEFYISHFSVQVVWPLQRALLYS